MDLTIRPLETQADAEAFRELNEEWIGRHFVIEEQDRRQLADPVAAYVEAGGEILIAEHESRPVGCVALMPDGTGAYELSKMAIAPDLRGRGGGRGSSPPRSTAPGRSARRRSSSAAQRSSRTPSTCTRRSASGTSRPRASTCPTTGLTCSWS